MDGGEDVIDDDKGEGDDGTLVGGEDMIDDGEGEGGEGALAGGEDMIDDGEHTRRRRRQDDAGCDSGF